MTEVKPRKWRMSIEGALALVVAVGFVVAACVQSADVYWLRQRGEVVTGTVTQKHESRRGDSSISVRYTTQVGDTLIADTSKYRYAEVDKPIEVLYDPAKPDRMQAADFSRSYSYPLYSYGSFAVFALLLVLLELRFGFLTQFRKFGRHE
ncbi:DUF3592 domain-containing protein [Kribbella antibiotica]|uniref:DUF3592 domain-containing protein n=1 Tax=Kribbella antibiotica TaxID=190195 RepID=A0A4R4ZKF0_9ACTN|nr:DUF3592 domain-containing protein [Kribbella antibiotica]TDD58274.1 DUF3592 domain-containing protein [Kribbella antibiotica]